MFLRPVSAPVSLAEAAPAADRWLDLHTRFAPMLWLVGILHASAALMVITGTLRRPRGALTNLLVTLWAAVAILQAVSSLLNGVLLSDTGLGIRHALSFTSVGWLFAAMAIATGASSCLDGRAAARLYCRLAVYTLVLGTLTLLVSAAGLVVHDIPTPLSILSNTSEVVRQYAGVKFVHDELTMGAHTARLVLMYPWAPALGIGSLGLLLICTRCQHAAWRPVGICGALVGVIFSWSRLAVVAGAIVICLLALQRAPASLRVVFAFVAAATAALLVLFGISPLMLLDGFYSSVNDARAGSSLARDLIVEASWAGFLDSPWIGHGWTGESVHPTEHLPIGSHSTIYGTLYTGGILVFAGFALAMLATLAVLGWRRYDEKDVERRKDIDVALALAFILCVATRYEAISSLSLPCFFYFTWIGFAAQAKQSHQVGALGASTTAPAAAPLSDVVGAWHYTRSEPPRSAGQKFRRADPTDGTGKVG